jgi:alpha/beta superfamily hydrolase
MFSDWQNEGAGEHRINIEGLVGNIDAIVHVPESYQESGVKAVAVCCHPHPLYEGSMTNKVVHTLAKSFAKMGLVAIRFNFRGVGKTEGEHDNTIGETEDLVHICKLIRERFPDVEIWLSGFSFGSYVAAKAAGRVSASQLLTVAPPVERFDFTDINPVNCPWFVVMGEEDEIVSPEAVFDWVNANPARYHLLKFPETGHFYHGKLVKLSQEIQNYYLPVVEAL